MRIDIEIDSLQELVIMGQVLQDDELITAVIALYLSLVGDENQKEKFIRELSKNADTPENFTECIYKWIEVPDIYNHIIGTSSLVTQVTERLMNN